ncbi:MAG: gamma-glutamyl-gamma-aminobutyrate hydrolase family protein, partial [Bacteroidales bacterium]|nr:gamma-glutamyl-gamma-aminobutyrate hydrolase family protein [Bacteroidales bacterium]
MNKAVFIFAIFFTALLSFQHEEAVSQIKERPVIGISSTMGGGSSTSAPLTYINSVIKAGGIPVVIPLTADRELLSSLLKSLDGIVMTGGEDVDPLKWYGEE